MDEETFIKVQIVELNKLIEKCNHPLMIIGLKERLQSFEYRLSCLVDNTTEK